MCVGGVSSHRWRGGERAGVFVKPIGRPHILPSRSEVRSPHISPSIRVQGTSYLDECEFSSAGSISDPFAFRLRLRMPLIFFCNFDLVAPIAFDLKQRWPASSPASP